MKVKHKKGSNTVHLVLTARKFENKANSLTKFKGYILDSLTRKRDVKPTRVQITYKWGYAKGQKRYSMYDLPERPAYYYNSILYPKGNKITQKNLLKFAALDLMEKYEFYAYELEYEKPYNLREITFRFIYE